MTLKIKLNQFIEEKIKLFFPLIYVIDNKNHLNSVLNNNEVISLFDQNFEVKFFKYSRIDEFLIFFEKNLRYFEYSKNYLIVLNKAKNINFYDDFIRIRSVSFIFNLEEYLESQFKINLYPKLINEFSLILFANCERIKSLDYFKTKLSKNYLKLNKNESINFVVYLFLVKFNHRINPKYRIVNLLNLFLIDTENDFLAIYNKSSILPEIFNKHINETYGFYILEKDLKYREPENEDDNSFVIINKKKYILNNSFDWYIDLFILCFLSKFLLFLFKKNFEHPMYIKKIGSHIFKIYLGFDKKFNEFFKNLIKITDETELVKVLIEYSIYFDVMIQQNPNIWILNRFINIIRNFEPYYNNSINKLEENSLANLGYKELYDFKMFRQEITQKSI